ncbi:hypothetical protein PKOR_15950 [Pontibacter korlensis]|uniref:Uncharacterized protein n=1 Tax=Pontibacter korlensis TaxID=400092 RepID=A0A0E3ZFF2_9BACT|nr:hypothetical protein PKOR_15950 [Pontibacter korlensis]
MVTVELPAHEQVKQSKQEAEERILERKQQVAKGKLPGYLLWRKAVLQFKLLSFAAVPVRPHNHVPQVVGGMQESAAAPGCYIGNVRFFRTLVSVVGIMVQVP